MQPLDFLAAVLPSSGFYCVAEFDTPRREHVFLSDIREIPNAANVFVQKGLHSYFALAAYKTKDNRTADNARVLKSLFIDVDLGDKKKYKSRKEAAQAFEDFMLKTGMNALGQPIVVSSGGGYHIYWPLTEEVEVSRWKPVAENFKRLLKQEGMEIDWNCTADAARVLRVPGTLNFKFDPPKPVKLLGEGSGPFDLETIEEFINSKLVVKPVAVPTINLPGARPTPKGQPNLTLMSNSVTVFKNILSRTKDGTGCAQLAHYVENASDEGMEPLWRAMLSIAKPCKDGGKAAVWLSQLHPYDSERMQTKLNEIKGPYACVKIDSLNPGVCTGCPHFGKITNPLALGRETAVDNTEKEIVVEPPPDTPTAPPAPATITRPIPPKGYSYGKNGGVYMDKTDTDAQGNQTNKQLPLLPYDLFVVNILCHNNEHTVHMLAMRPTGPQEITMSQRAIASKDETIKTLAQQNVMALFGSGNDKNLYEYIRAAVEQASANQKTVAVPDSYGWQTNDTFVFNERVYAPQSVPRHIPMRNLVNINKATVPTGTLENWRKVINLLTARKMHEILAISLVGFGAPLMRFTGYDGFTWHLGSSESGTGKTLTLELAASVWGHPTKFRVSKSTSDVAMQQRLGLLNSMPLISDEITSKNRKDFEWVPGFIFDMAEGQGKERMESGANKERENTTYWKSMALLSSNTHVIDYLTGARKHSSEGEIRRVLELTLSNIIEWQDGDTEIISTLKNNYGVAGQRYVQFLVDNKDVVEQVVQQVRAKLKRDFQFTDDERYWLAGCTCLIAGGLLAGSMHANIADFPMAGITEVLRKMVQSARTTIKANVRTAEDILNAYIREFYGKFVVVKALDNAMAASLGDSGIIDQSITRSEIFGRVEHNVTVGFVDFYIEEKLMKQYCSSMSFGYTDFKRQMEAVYMVGYSKKDLMAKTKGPQMRVNAIKISRRVSEDDEDTVSVEAA
jgi:hypothetical protein